MNPPEIKAVGIHSPGDMGHAIGRELRSHGLDVVSCLAGRSARTRSLSQQAGIRDVESLHGLVHQCDMLLSILVPSQAEKAAQQVANAIRETAAVVHYIDCNAISPDSVKRIEKNIVDAGGVFSDGSIIGLPPGTATTPRLYVSGQDARQAEALDGKGILIKVLGAEIGQASGIKMCYAAMTKGTFALHYALAIVAERLNLLDQLMAELEFSQPEGFQCMHRFLPRIPSKASRWVGEMEEIAATFESLGITPRFLQGAARMYELISETSLGKETAETIDYDRTLETTIKELSRQLGGDKV